MDEHKILLINAKQTTLERFMAVAVCVMGASLGCIVGTILIAGVQLTQIYVYSVFIVIPLPISFFAWLVWLKTTMNKVEITESGINATFKNNKLWKSVKDGIPYTDRMVGFTSVDEQEKGIINLSFNYEQVLYARYFKKKENSGFRKAPVVEIFYLDENNEGKKFLVYVTRKELDKIKMDLGYHESTDYINDNFSEKDFLDKFGFERHMITFESV